MIINSQNIKQLNAMGLQYYLSLLSNLSVILKTIKTLCGYSFQVVKFNVAKLYPITMGQA